MQEWIHVLEKDDLYLQVQLNKEWTIQPSLFSQMEMDETCIKCFILNQQEGIISYQIDNRICLKDVLEQYTFQQEDGLLFLVQLLKAIIASNRNKPILLDPEFIYVSKHGDEFYFISVPIQMENHFLSKEEQREFLTKLLLLYKSDSHFEIPGYICCFLKSEEFSLSNCILGLENCAIHQKRHFLFHKRKKKSFRVAEPFVSLYSNEPDLPKVDENHTQLIGQNTPSNSYLLIQQERYDLRTENVLVGRSMACDIRLLNPSVSLKHARFSMSEGKWYIQDLKSTNGTTLNDKKVQRKMRCKDGMIIHFGQVECEFHT